MCSLWKAALPTTVERIINEDAKFFINNIAGEARIATDIKTLPKLHVLILSVARIRTFVPVKQTLSSCSAAETKGGRC